MGLKTSLATAVSLSVLLAMPASADQLEGMPEHLSDLLADGAVCYLTEATQEPYILDTNTGEVVQLPEGLELNFVIDETSYDPEDDTRIGDCRVSAANGDMDIIPLRDDFIESRPQQVAPDKDDSPSGRDIIDFMRQNGLLGPQMDA